MKSHIILLLIFIAAWPLTADADKAAKLNKKAIDSYLDNNLEESARLFTEALVERPDSPELRFNRGTALSATGKKDEAVNELEKAAYSFENNESSAAAHFNAGNTFFGAGQLNEAIESYKKALKLDQSSRDIRHNLELALRKLQDQQQQQQQENKDDEQKKDESENEQQDEQKQDEKSEEKEDKSENNDKQRDEQEQQSEQPEQSPQQENEQQPMTPEEAQRILDAIENEEKKAFSLRREKMRTEMRRGDDW